MRRRRILRRIGSLLLRLALCILALRLFFAALNGLDAAACASGAERLEEALRRAAVSRYAAEGRYPATLAELREHSGVQADEARYRVHYRVFAANLMPEIRVTERTK